MQQNPLWERGRIYLIIWLGLLLVVIAASLVTYWDSIWAVLSESLTSMLSSVCTIALMIYIIVSMVRGRW